jgi:hypothetical protein
MIVWGGVSFFGFTDTGGRYDPETDTWSPTTTTGAPAGRIFHTAVWTGTEMIVWGGRGIGDEEYLSSGGRYTPGTSDTPVLTLVAAPAILWPPNHKMVTVHITGQIVDACDPHPALTLVSVTSSEPDDATGAGDGHTLGDIAGADIGSPDMTIALRAERDGIGPGRVYTITYRVVDALGNSTLASTIVTVPHDQSGSAGDDGGDRGPHHGGHESPPGKHHHAHGNGR